MTELRYVFNFSHVDMANPSDDELAFGQLIHDFCLHHHQNQYPNARPEITHALVIANILAHADDPAPLYKGVMSTIMAQINMIRADMGLPLMTGDTAQ